jgi:hypothetical protein
MIGIQGHPEFDPAYSGALMESRRGSLIPEATVDDGMSSLDREIDGDRLVDWILRRFSSDAHRSS